MVLVLIGYAILTNRTAGMNNEIPIEVYPNAFRRAVFIDPPEAATADDDGEVLTEELHCQLVIMRRAFISIEHKVALCGRLKKIKRPKIKGDDNPLQKKPHRIYLICSNKRDRSE